MCLNKQVDESSLDQAITLQMTKTINGACRQGVHRSHGLSLIRRKLYPTELLGDTEVWRHV